MKYAVGDLQLDTGPQSVSRSGLAIALPKLSYDLLLVLVRAAPNVVSLDEIMRRVWAGLVVSPETVTKRVMLLRDALGEDPKAPRYIAGLRGRGYRIIATVSQLPDGATANGDPAKLRNFPLHILGESSAPRFTPDAAITPLPVPPTLTRTGWLPGAPVILLASAVAALTAAGAWHLWSQAQAAVRNANVIPNLFAGTWVGTIETCSPTTTYFGPFTVAISNTQSDLLRLVYYGYGPDGAVRLTGSYDLRTSANTAKSVAPSGVTYTLKNEELTVNYPDVCQHGILHRQNLRRSP